MFLFSMRSLSIPAYRRLYSTAQSPPPILLKLRTGLKDAMRSKDTNKLNVIRGLLSDITNASKSATPPKTDLDILSLINKTRAKSAASVVEFRGAGREDLAVKEEGQIAVLDSYAEMVDKVGEGEIVTVVDNVIKAVREGGGKVDLGHIMKKALGEFAGRPVVKGEIAAVVKEALKTP